MRRLQLFEFGDQRWLPATARDSLTGHLHDLLSAPAAGELHAAIAGVLAPALLETGCSRVVDLCSGATGPLRPVLDLVERSISKPLTVVATDLYPNRSALRDAQMSSSGRLSASLLPVDARRVPHGLLGFRTLFTSLHHFRPTDVCRVLDDAVGAGQPIGAFEPFERSWAMAGLLAIGGAREGWRLARSSFRERGCSSVMIMPLALSWDGAISALRSYRPDELLALADRADADGVFQWRAGSVRLARGRMTYLLGLPHPRTDAAPASRGSPGTR